MSNKKHAIWAGLLELVLVGSAGAAPLLQKLSLDKCTPLVQSAFKPALAADWSNYQAYTKVCPLKKTLGATAFVYLVSVFAEDYYNTNPGVKEWKKFPLPLLLTADGRCLAQLPEHFPFDQPVDLTLSFGVWQKDIPAQIAVHVSNPAVGGDYELPKLFWDAKVQKYIARKNTTQHTIKETECPI